MAALCDLLNGTGLTRDCNLSFGGIQKFYVLEKALVTGTTEVSDVLTSISTSGASNFVEVEFTKETANFDEKTLVNLENGSTFFEKTVNVNLTYRSKTKRAFITKLLAGQKDLFIIIKANDLYWAIGHLEGAQVSAIEGGTGTKREDKNGYMITFLARENAQAPEVDASIIAALIS